MKCPLDKKDRRIYLDSNGKKRGLKGVHMKIIHRIGYLLMAFILVFSMTTTAFAASEETPENPDVPSESMGNDIVVASGHNSFYHSGTVTVTLPSNATATYVKVLGNTNGGSGYLGTASIQNSSYLPSASFSIDGQYHDIDCVNVTGYKTITYYITVNGDWTTLYNFVVLMCY